MAEAAEQVVALWEQGQRLSPLGRTLLLLRAAEVELDARSAAELSLGARDAALLSLRERLFGCMLPAFTLCPRCRAELEVQLTTVKVRAAAAQAGATFTEVFDGVGVQYRLPSSADLHHVGGQQDAQAAYRALLERCVLSADRDGAGLAPAELPAAVADALAARMLEHDPQAEVLLDVTCLECGHCWQAVLDIGSYLWSEISTAARRLLLEVHSLALAYGWREQEILALGPQRRRFYLEHVGTRHA